jgi:transcription termination factor 2
MVWKRFIAAHNSDERKRLNMLLKCIMLRRTKKELEEAGTIAKLPEKTIIEMRLTLSDEEQTVHDLFLSFSQAIFSKYLEQKSESNPELKHLLEQKSGKISVSNLHRKFQALFHTRNVKINHIFVLLLRLRQLVCHPALIMNQLPDEHNLNEFSDDEDQPKSQRARDSSSNEENSDEEESSDDLEAFDIMGELCKLIKNGEFDDTNEPGDDKTVPLKSKCLSRENPVFDHKNPSTKIKMLLPLIKEKLELKEKVIVVSVFTSFLNIIANYLHDNDIAYCLFTGKTSIPSRNEMVTYFNDPDSETPVMLLSLTAGSVGLNLTGANNMFILDVYWNPQQELQVMDRIHRFGQVKSVNIVK